MTTSYLQWRKVLSITLFLSLIKYLCLILFLFSCAFAGEIPVNIDIEPDLPNSLHSTDWKYKYEVDKHFESNFVVRLL